MPLGPTVHPETAPVQYSEDGIADTVKPRLEQAGANTSKVHVLEEVTITDELGREHSVPPALPRDFSIIERILTEYSIDLLIVDVLMAYISKGDTRSDSDMRSLILYPLKRLAEQSGAAVLAIRHLNKTSGGNALYRAGGSIAITGAFRAEFLAATNPLNPSHKVFTPSKLNIAKTPPALSYRIVSPSSGEIASSIQWMGEIDTTAAELLTEETPDQLATRSEAQNFLVQYLLGTKSREAPARDVINAAKEAGFTHSEMTHARYRCRTPKVISKRKGFGESGRFMWSIAPAISASETDVPSPSTKDLGHDIHATYENEK